MYLRLAAAGVVFVAMAACAPMVTTAPATLDDTPVAAPPRDVRLVKTTDIALPTGYRRTLATTTTWRPAGRLPQGAVYRPVDSVFTIEGRQVHEAWLVVADGARLVGFYLPGEARYSPLDTTIRLSLGESK